MVEADATTLRTYSILYVSKNKALSEKDGDPTSTNLRILDTEVRFPADYITNMVI